MAKRKVCNQRRAKSCKFKVISNFSNSTDLRAEVCLYYNFYLIELWLHLQCHRLRLRLVYLTEADQEADRGQDCWFDNQWMKSNYSTWNMNLIVHINKVKYKIHKKATVKLYKQRILTYVVFLCQLQLIRPYDDTKGRQNFYPPNLIWYC